MQERDLVIAAAFAALLHCGVALVSAPALQPHPLSENKALAISIISEYKRSLEITEVAAYETKEEESQKTYDRKEVTLKKSVEKGLNVPAEGSENTDTPKSAPAQISASPPPLQVGQDTGMRAEKIVTEPAIPCYKSNPPPKYPEIARRRGYHAVKGSSSP